MIEIVQLARRFGAFALGPITLTIQKGSYFILLGPSGSGKSMLLSTIAGIFRPDAGNVLLDGQDATSLPPEKRNIGFVFQQSALFPHMTVTGNIEYGLRARSVAAEERKQRIAEVIEKLEIAPLLDRPVATLSGGEAQKVAIARALAIRPQVLLLDEPLGPIDRHARDRLQEELARIHELFNLTTLHVTHSHDEARALGDHAAVMMAGRIIQQNKTESLFGSPHCPFVGRFLGVPFDETKSLNCSESCRNPAGRCDEGTPEQRS